MRQLSDFCQQHGLGLFVRFHPREVEQGHNMLQGISYNRFDEYDPLPLIAQSRVVLVQHSTIALEAIGLSVPIIEYAPSSTQEVEQSWHSHYKVASKISSTIELKALLGDLSQVDEAWRKLNIPVDGMARERVAAVIEMGGASNDN